MYTPLPISSEPEGGRAVAPRKSIYARYVDGRFHRLRNLSSTVLQIALFVVPWLTWGDRPLVWLDIQGRKFHLPGFTLWPQETHFLWLTLLFLALTLFLTTTLVGRIWCGYACPQTLLTQSFMMVERWFEGDRARRLRAAQHPTAATRARRLLTLGAWAGMAFWLGLTLVGYLHPIRVTIQELLTGQLAPGWLLLLAFVSCVSFLDFGFFREQMCHYVCPYARFQSALFDSETLLVAYDTCRGEPKGKHAGGDCVDCGWCVQVCPMGIDIRQGSQLECISCGACIDACQPVMEKLHRPTGLIGYRPVDSDRHRWLRPRVKVYLTLLGIVGTLLVGSWLARSPWDFTVARKPTVIKTAEGLSANCYELHLVNRTEEPLIMTVALRGLPGGAVALAGNPRTVKGGELVRCEVVVTAPAGALVRSFQFEVTTQGVTRCKPASFLQL